MKPLFLNLQKFNRRLPVSLPSVLVMSGAFAMLPQVAQAGNTWTGGAGGTGTSWNDAANWGGALPATTDNIYFTSVGTGSTSSQTIGSGKVISLDASQTVKSLNINSYSSAPAFVIGNAADNTAGYTLTLTNVYRGDNVGNTQTIAANVNLAADSTWNIINGYNGFVAVTGSIGSGSAVTLTKEGSNNLTLNGANTFTGGLRVLGGGLTLGNSNAYTGSTTASGGGLNINFATSASTNTINSASGLILGGIRGGGTVTVTGKNTASSINSQSFAGLTLNPASSTMSIVNGIASGNTLVALGGIARSTGATVNFVQPTVNSAISATNGFTTSTANDASGILGAYATVGGTNWATNDGTNILAYTGYTILFDAAPNIVNGVTTNVRIDDNSTDTVGQAAGTVTVNTVSANDPLARTIAVGTGNTLRLGAVGGILSTGAGGLTVGTSGAAGTLTAGGADNTAGELILNNSTALVVNSVVANNGSGVVALTKSGAGTTTLAATNTHTGATTLNGGVLAFAPNTIMSSTTTVGTTVTVASTAGLTVGQTVSGSGIPAFTRIASITDATHYVLSQAATAAATVNLVYYTASTTALTSTTSDPKTVTVASTAGLAAGQTVTGTGIPASTTIASITDGTTLVLSKAATASGTVDLLYAGSTTLSSTTTDGKAVTVASTAGLVVGQMVTGTGIPAYATIASITDGTTFVLSTPATAGGTVSLAYANNALSTAGDIVVNGGTFELGSPSAAQTVSGAVIVTGGSLSNGTLAKSGGNYDVHAGTINTRLTGAVGLDKSTFGTLTFANTVGNTFTGDTTITEGRVNGSTSGAIAINGNLIVGSAGGGGGGASYYNNNGSVNFNRAKNVTVHGNGTVDFGSAAQNLDAGVSILGGYLYGGQIYQNTTINMTGGTFAGGAYGTTNSYTTSASANTAVISAGLLSGANKNFTVADGAAATDLLLSGGLATNSAGIVKSGAGKMHISSSSSHTGATTISGGTLSVTTLANGGSGSSIGASANTAANLKLGNGTTFQYAGSGHSTDRLFTINGTAAGHSATLDASGTGAVNLTNTGNVAYGTTNQARTLVLAGTSAADNTLAAAVGNNGTGVVSLIKNDAGKWILSGTNTYTGDTTVNGGTLVLPSTGPSTFDDASMVTIGDTFGDDAVLTLPVAGTDVVAALIIDGVMVPDGLYGSTNTGGAITGPGKIQVGTGVGSGYGTWASSNANNQTANLDYDLDGVLNGVEYFMGATGSTFTPNPSVVTVGATRTITWPKSATFDGSYAVKTSTDLINWTDVTLTPAVVDNGTSVVYTLPAPSGKIFARLLVIPN